MHDTAMEIGERFFRTYVNERTGLTVLDIGAQDVNGSLKSVCPPANHYVGVDFVAGKGVDIVISDPYSLPVGDEFADVVVCSSCFEHSEFFWLLFNEIQRILRPNGICYLNVPSNGSIHRFPVDCWRFYPDSGIALQNWARRGGYKTALLESFTSNQKANRWNDFVAVFVKDVAFAPQFPKRIQDTYQQFTNGQSFGSTGYVNATDVPEDQNLSFRVIFYKWCRHVYSNLPTPLQAPSRIVVRFVRRLRR
jgi:SAM-dependent methyltransferase